MEMISFDFPSFSPLPPTISLQGDCSVSAASLELNNDAQYSCGRAVYSKPIRLWDKKTGNAASFSTRFSFSVFRDPEAEGYADGMVFFLSAVDYVMPDNATGGGFTLFDHYKKAPVVAVEFDTYQNEFDMEVPHIGIDVNYVESVKERDWDPFWGSDNFTATAEITYDSENCRLSASFSQEDGNYRVLSYNVDLRKELPERVTVGLAGSTGYFFERHVIHSWRFSSSLELSGDGGTSSLPELSPFQPLCEAPSCMEKKDSSAIVGGVLACAAAVGIAAAIFMRRP